MNPLALRSQPGLKGRLHPAGGLFSFRSLLLLPPRIFEALAQRQEQPVLTRSIRVRSPGASTRSRGPRPAPHRARPMVRTPASEAVNRSSSLWLGFLRRRRERAARAGFSDNRIMKTRGAGRAAPKVRWASRSIAIGGSAHRCRRSSMAERPVVNRGRGGSNPPGGVLASAARKSSA